MYGMVSRLAILDVNLLTSPCVQFCLKIKEGKYLAKSESNIGRTDH
jgi:hypothetical protein